jgi:hypothetical protein
MPYRQPSTQTTAARITPFSRRMGAIPGFASICQRRRASTLPKSQPHLASPIIKVYSLASPWKFSEDFMETRNVAVCDKFGNRLKTYPITLEKRENGPGNDEFAVAALEWARRDKLVPAVELDHLTVKVPAVLKLWR